MTGAPTKQVWGSIFGQTSHWRAGKFELSLPTFLPKAQKRKESPPVLWRSRLSSMHLPTPYREPRLKSFVTSLVRSSYPASNVTLPTLLLGISMRNGPPQLLERGPPLSDSQTSWFLPAPLLQKQHTRSNVSLLSSPIPTLTTSYTHQMASSILPSQSLSLEECNTV